MNLICNLFFSFVLFFNLFSNAQIYVPQFTDIKSLISTKIINSNKQIEGFIYKFDDKDILNDFINIGEKGVKINLICDENAYDMAKQLKDYGNITLFKDPNNRFDKLHAKGLLFDDEELLVGSFNLDKTTFSTNYEIIAQLNENKYINDFKNKFIFLTEYLNS